MSMVLGCLAAVVDARCDQGLNSEERRTIKSEQVKIQRHPAKNGSIVTSVAGSKVCRESRMLQRHES